MNTLIRILIPIRIIIKIIREWTDPAYQPGGHIEPEKWHMVDGYHMSRTIDATSSSAVPHSDL